MHFKLVDNLTMLCLLLFIGLLHAAVAELGGDTFRAAVVEFAQRGSTKASPASNLRDTLDALQSSVVRAKAAGASIVVYSEAILWIWPDILVYEGKLTPEEGRKEMRLYGQALPPVGTIAKPADASPFGVISKLAAKHEVIIVFNMVDLQPCTSCPGGEGQFNADVVVGAAGQLLATYHKSHLYGSSPLLDEPSRPDPTSFVAPSLGGGQVRFGMLICYDMQFLTPGAALLAQNITHFVFSTSWVNQPPLYVATMIQQGWSRRHGTVLIAANRGAGRDVAGSGIYVAGEAIAQRFDPTTPALPLGDVVIVADVPISYRAGNTALAKVKAPASSEHTSSRPRPRPHALALPSQPCTIASTGDVNNGSCVVFDAAATQGAGAGAGGGNVNASASRAAMATTTTLTATSLDGVVNCTLTYTLESASLHANAQGPAPFALFAANGAYSFPGTPDAQVVGTCAVMQCAPSRVVSSSDGDGALVCAATYNSSRGLFANFVLRGVFAKGSQALPMVAAGEVQLLNRSEIEFDQEVRKVDGRVVASVGVSSFAELHAQRLYSAVLYAVDGK